MKFRTKRKSWYNPDDGFKGIVWLVFFVCYLLCFIHSKHWSRTKPTSLKDIVKTKSPHNPILPTPNKEQAIATKTVST